MFDITCLGNFSTSLHIINRTVHITQHSAKNYTANNQCNKQYHKNVVLSPENIELLENYSWPGNIRELENIIEYLVLCSSGIGQVDDSIIAGLLNISQEQEPTITADMDFSSAVAQFEKNLLETTLKTSGNLREAGKKLNINASTISRKIKQYNIDYPNKKE